MPSADNGLQRVSRSVLYSDIRYFVSVHKNNPHENMNIKNTYLIFKIIFSLTLHVKKQDEISRQVVRKQTYRLTSITEFFEKESGLALFIALSSILRKPSSKETIVTNLPFSPRSTSRK